MRIAGILNLTPDSFSDGGSYATAEDAVRAAEKMFFDGAEMIDVGGESTRPGATPISAAEEIKRVEPVLKLLRGNLSIDTYHWQTAERALELGVTTVNDVTGFSDARMLAVARTFRASVIVMCPVNATRDYFLRKCDALEKAGIAREKMMIDPGFGFGKSVAQNWEILHDLERFAGIAPLYVAFSRKRFLGGNEASTLDAVRISARAADFCRLHPPLIAQAKRLIG